MTTQAIDADASPRVSIVVLTYNRRDELLRTLGRLRRHYPRHPVIVVDNASADGTAAAVQQAFPDVRLLRAPANEGAAGRNRGCMAAATPYVAFCDDDTCWEAGALQRAQQLFDAWPELAVASAQVRVGDEGRPDPACEQMAGSPLPGLPGVGPGLVGFMAGACVVRREAFLQVGGYWPPLFIGGEEELLALDLLRAGWRIVYAPGLATRHWPSTLRDAPRRRGLLARNALWIAWMRLPAGMAWRRTRRALAEGGAALLAQALPGLPRALAHRRPLPGSVLAQLRQVQATRG
ncbi:glycosyltransferase family 2 protein [Burkholderia multivorans]|uniref:glycosyltransferase family 2 protein n=1 Tax=Burkholderia multivorans TaxID=87883 RepID=UPI001C24EB0B|nr:glycosyltransferase [Burkholderia multivorans]MBU9365992.1 glycosyltransferase [Burkholderia multivorans]